MPGNIINTTPKRVFPMGTMLAFEEQIERPALLDDGYAEGESTRNPLTLFARRRFRVARPLRSAEADIIEAFYYDTLDKGETFWFYNLRETEPPGSWDPSGANPVGRYACDWDGPLVRNVILSGRPIVIEVSLREVES